MSAARDAIEKAVCFLTMEPTAYVNLAKPTTPEQTSNIPERTLTIRLLGNTVTELSHLSHIANKTVTAFQTDEVIGKPTRNAYCVRTIQTKNVLEKWHWIYKCNSTQLANITNIREYKGPPVVTIMHAIGAAPTESINQQSEDHNWRWRIPYKYCAKENWPNLKEGRTRNAYINKQRHLDGPVETQTPKQTDGHQIVNKMDNSIDKNFESLHLSTWIPIRDEEPPQHQTTAKPETIRERNGEALNTSNRYNLVRSTSCRYSHTEDNNGL